MKKGGREQWKSRTEEKSKTKKGTWIVEKKEEGNDDGEAKAEKGEGEKGKGL